MKYPNPQTPQHRHPESLNMNHATKDRSLLAIARECRERAEAMTGTELDVWYFDNVGYSILEDDPRTTPAEHTAQVAAMMFYHALPAGVNTPGAEVMERTLSLRILGGGAL